MLVVCALGLFLEVLEISFSNSLAAIFSAPKSGVTSGSLGLLLSSVYLGAIAGSPLFGYACDRYGRVKALIAVLSVLAISSACAAASLSMGWLVAARILTGVSIGAYQPVFVAYLTDVLPPKQRGLLFFSVIAFGFLGFPAGAFLIRFLTPIQPFGLEAWRCACLAGSGGSLLVALAACLLPESPRWLARRGRTEAAQAMLRRFERSRVAVSSAHVDRGVEPASELPVALLASRLQTVVICAMFFVSPWATVAFPILTGAVLMAKGFRLSDALLYVGLSTFGPVLGTLLAAVYVDRIPRRGALLICAVVMLLSGYAFSNSDTANWLIGANLTFTIATVLYVPLLNVYCAELLPTKARALVFSGAWTANRVGSAIAPLALVPLLHAMGPTAMFDVVALFLLIGLGLLAVSAPGRQRLPVL